MAKNKNRERKAQDSRKMAEHGAEQAPKSSLEAQSDPMPMHAGPSDVAHKGRQKRFGHN